MNAPTTVVLTRHDELPAAEAAVVDRGLGEANDKAAPLHEVRPLSCFARDGGGRTVGGAICRTWGSCCELLQLWVHPAVQGQGIGRALVREFEAAASTRGCVTCFLETFSFQAPDFYRALGYEIAYGHTVYPHAIVRYTMVRRLPAPRRAAV